MLVNDNTAEYNVSQEKRKYHENIHDGAIGMKSRLVGFLKQAKNCVSDWSLWSKDIARAGPSRWGGPMQDIGAGPL